MSKTVEQNAADGHTLSARVAEPSATLARGRTIELFRAHAG